MTKQTVFAIVRNDNRVLVLKAKDASAAELELAILGLVLELQEMGYSVESLAHLTCRALGIASERRARKN